MNNKHGLGTATFMVVASMLGTGILTTSGLILQLVHAPQTVIYLWMMGGGLTLTGAWCYGELIKSVPESGGEAIFLRRLMSRQVGEAAGITSFVVGFAACNAASSIAVSDYLNEALPSVSFHQESTAIFCLLLVTSLHLFLGPLGLKIQNSLAAFKFLLLLILVFVGLYFTPPLGAHQESPALQGQAEFGSIGVGFMLVMFAYSGWNAAIYAASEIENPARTVKRAMIIGSSIVITLYVLLNYLLFSRVSADVIEGVRPVISVLIQHIYGKNAVPYFSGFVAVALLSSLAVSAYLGPRVLSSVMGWKDSEAVQPVPLIMKPALVWVQMLLSCFMVLTGTFLQILTVMGFLLGFFPILAAFSIYRIRSSTQSLSLKITKMFIAPFFILLSASILFLSTFNKPRESILCGALLLSFFVLRNIGRVRAWRSVTASGQDGFH